MRSHRDPHSFLMRRQNGTAAVEDSLAVTYKTKHTLAIQSANCTPWDLPRGAENISNWASGAVCPAEIAQEYLVARVSFSTQNDFLSPGLGRQVRSMEPNLLLNHEGGLWSRNGPQWGQEAGSNSGKKSILGQGASPFSVLTPSRCDLRLEGRRGDCIAIGTSTWSP